jgi:hypothetical protein
MAVGKDSSLNFLPPEIENGSLLTFPFLANGLNSALNQTQILCASEVLGPAALSVLPEWNVRLFLLISAPFYKPYSPATSLHTGLIPPLANSLRAARCPCLRTSCPLLGRCLVVRNRDKRHAEHGGKDSSENKMCHASPPRNSAQSYAHFLKRTTRIPSILPE